MVERPSLKAVGAFLGKGQLAADDTTTPLTGDGTAILGRQCGNMLERKKCHQHSSMEHQTADPSAPESPASGPDQTEFPVYRTSLADFGSDQSVH